jgi:predicted RNA-binding Zn ribbon-like protein
MSELGSDGGAVWVLPDEPVPVRLMNTIWADRHGVHDALSRPADLADWLHEIGAPADLPPVTPEDLARARELRDGLRRLASLQTDDTRPAAASAVEDAATAVGIVNRVATGLAPPRLELRGDALGMGAHPAGRPAAALLADIAVSAMALLTDPNAPPLRACFAPGCVLYFVQAHPRREWCSTACGNRARAARHYQRHRSPIVSPSRAASPRVDPAE